MDPNVSKYVAYLQNSYLSNKEHMAESIGGKRTVSAWSLENLGIKFNPNVIEVRKNLYEKMEKNRKVLGLPNFAMEIYCETINGNKNECQINYLQETIYKAMMQNEKEEAESRARESIEKEKLANNNINKGEGNLPIFFAGAGFAAIGAFILSSLNKSN